MKVSAGNDIKFKNVCIKSIPKTFYFVFPVAALKKKDRRAFPELRDELQFAQIV